MPKQYDTTTPNRPNEAVDVEYDKDIFKTNFMDANGSQSEFMSKSVHWGQFDSHKQ